MEIAEEMITEEGVARVIVELERKEAAGTHTASDREKLTLLYFLVEDLQKAKFFLQRQTDLNSAYILSLRGQEEKIPYLKPENLLSRQKKDLYYEMAKSLLNRDYAEFYSIIKNLQFPSEEVENSLLLSRVCEKTRERVVLCISNVYKTIAVGTFASMVGLDPEDAIRLAKDMGFKLDDQYLIPIPLADEEKRITAIEKLGKTKEYALDMEDSH